MSKKQTEISKKIKKIMSEGIRQNTHKPVSKSNPRHPVSQKQAVAVAIHMSEKKSSKKKK